MSSPIKPFRAIIAGGGPSGLVLAHCLNAAGIDFVLLERRAVIIEPSGAGLGIWPSCARLLDQLGLFEKAMNLCKPMTDYSSYDNNCILIKRLPFYTFIGEKFGYPFLGYDRHEFLQMLYDSLPNKSFIRTGVRIVGVEQDEDRVYAILEDGSREVGDILIGADGIHSTVARALPSDAGWCEKNFTASYIGIWGISSIPPRSPPHEMFLSHDTKFCFQSLAQTDKMMWITYIKLDSILTESSYYSDAEMEKVAQKYFDVPVSAECTFRDIWNHRIRAGMSTLEEGLQQTWHHGRVVLVGDSAHKFTPNMAIGFNNAFESAAALTNQLHAMLHSNHTGAPPDLKAISKAFSTYEKARLPRVTEQYKLSHWHLRLIAWDNWFLKWTDKLLVKIMPEGVTMEQVCTPFKGAGRLEFLEMPRREKGWGAFDDETDQKAAWDLRTILRALFALAVGVGSITWLRPSLVKMLVPSH